MRHASSDGWPQSVMHMRRSFESSGGSKEGAWASATGASPPFIPASHLSQPSSRNISGSSNGGSSGSNARGSGGGSEGAPRATSIAVLRGLFTSEKATTRALKAAAKDAAPTWSGEGGDLGDGVAERSSYDQVQDPVPQFFFFNPVPQFFL